MQQHFPCLTHDLTSVQPEMFFRLTFSKSQVSGLRSVALLGSFLASAHAEEIPREAAGALAKEQAAEIRSRIASLHAFQADFHRKVVSGEINPGADLRQQWPQIQERLGALRGQIASLNTLGTDSADRPPAEAKLLGALQEIGIHLETAGHPPFEPRVLDAAALAEMARIEKAIAAMEFGERAKAVPVKVLTPDPCFTLIHLPVPIVLQCRPGDSGFLSSDTGGAFHNGLSLIELRADSQGLAKTVWTSIGDAVADCGITVYSQAAIETQGIRIKVVSPSLPDLEGLPQPEHLKGEIPRLKSKAVIAKGLLDR